MQRTHTCGELRIAHAGEKVTLCGWVQKSRDMGPLIFIDLRDRYGITQINVSASNEEIFQVAKSLGREFVIQVTGTVKERESKNKNIPTGEIEVFPESLEVLNQSELPPFKIEDETDGLEELRLKYRYLDLRRPKMARNMILRSKVVRAVREYLDNQDFLEVETPVLIKSTPEGARDFLVPSRLQQGNFYALPQSPQILKQLLMVAGIDRYYQIVKCFRDEDFRGDRQPEFTQIDCEMSFVNQEDVWDTFDGMIRNVFDRVLGIKNLDIPRLTHAEAMAKYGTDKPDLRFGSEIVSLNEKISGTGFSVFDGAIENGGLVAGINAKGCGVYSNKQLKQLEEWVKDPERYKKGGAKGLVRIQFREDGTIKASLPNSIFTEEKLREIGSWFDAQPGDLVLIIADSLARTRKFLGDLRLELAKREGWINEDDWSVFWVRDFPLFEIDEETNERTFAHHPFCMPHPDDIHMIDSEPEKVRAMSYDLVINGNEICSGSVRVHRRDIQEKIFDLLGLSEAEQEAKFGFMLKAFQYGAPPHGGLAFGLDRMVMLMAKENSIRDVMAFPKNSSGRDLMMDAPANVPNQALEEAGIKIIADPKS